MPGHLLVGDTTPTVPVVVVPFRESSQTSSSRRFCFTVWEEACIGAISARDTDLRPYRKDGCFLAPLDIKYMLLSFILVDHAVNPDACIVLGTDSSTAPDFDPSHALNSNPGLTYNFDLYHGAVFEKAMANANIKNIYI
ncbi:hypothetical protein EVAR_37194_1 [Eumeta japonica]|uniref:Uncharacterized protein n=1 Tax=Eumeta variegata TaxID=151549 RepID=A0A4C1YYB8_EUMVA|nr:hypothetical protein EVAR_37194_1 [Eumeta japonica]